VANDEWETPKPLFELLDSEFGFELDAAASHKNHLCNAYYTKENSALEQDCWRHYLGREEPINSVWLNPPYSRGLISEFVKKAYEEAKNCGILVVCLLPADTSTIYWHEYCSKAYEIRFLKGRVKFLLDGIKADNSPPFPSAVVVFAPRKTKPKITFWDWRKEIEL
jgi:site-specific DNA-methyltransferase (adenine-specific)